MMGAIQADQDTSFQAMDRILRQMIDIVKADPAVDTVNGFTGGGGPRSGAMNTRACSFRSSRPRREKSAPTWSLRGCGPSLAAVPGATLYLQASQDVRVGGRFGAAQYQFTMRGDNLQDLQTFAPRMLQELRTIPIIADVNSDQQNRGLASLGAV